MAKKTPKTEKVPTDKSGKKKKLSSKNFVQSKTDSDEFQQRVRKVAQELFEKSGHIPGRDQENWLEAEKIVKDQTACC